MKNLLYYSTFIFFVIKNLPFLFSFFFFCNEIFIMLIYSALFFILLRGGREGRNNWGRSQARRKEERAIFLTSFMVFTLILICDNGLKVMITWGICSNRMHYLLLLSAEDNLSLSSITFFLQKCFSSIMEFPSRELINHEKLNQFLPQFRGELKYWETTKISLLILNIF